VQLDNAGIYILSGYSSGVFCYWDVGYIILVVEIKNMNELSCSNCQNPYTPKSLEKGICGICGTLISEDNLEPKLEIDEKKYQELLIQVESQQNLFMGLCSGFIAAIFGSLIWAVITAITEYQIGFMAVGVGFLVGYTIRIFGKGITDAFGIGGAILSLFGCLLGNVLSVCISISEYESIPIYNIISSLNIGLIVELLIRYFQPMDLLFYSIAIYEGYKFSFKKLNEFEIALITKEIN